METVVSYPGVKNCTAQRVMYIERPRVAEKRAYLALKRAFDISGALVGLAVLALPMSVIALIIALDSPGDPIFRQERLGKDGKPFTMYKFRSMYEDAERDGPRWADADDGRCTRFGAFLRRTRLDELPQIWNILKGDMSFVGPRPERACFYRLFEEYIVGFSNRLAVTPGLTGYAQVNGGYDLKPEEKIVYDMEYIEHRSVWMDLLCILKTIRVVFWDVAKILLSKLHWVLLAGIVAAALVYMAISVFVTPTYESRVSFYVYNSTNNTAQGTINNSDLQAAESLATTYSKILESNSVLDSVLTDIRGETALSRKELNRMVKVSVISDTQLLEVVVTSTDPKLACRIAGAFAKVAPTEIIRITKAGGVEVVDQPEVASEKTAPRTVFDSAIGFVIGVIMISVILVLRMLADTTIYLPEDIERAANVTILGMIPEINITNDACAEWALTEGGAVLYHEKEKCSENNEGNGSGKPEAFADQ